MQSLFDLIPTYRDSVCLSHKLLGEADARGNILITLDKVNSFKYIFKSYIKEKYFMFYQLTPKYVNMEVNLSESSETCLFISKLRTVGCTPPSPPPAFYSQFCLTVILLND